MQKRDSAYHEPYSTQGIKVRLSMLNELHVRLAAYLSEHHLCLVSAAGSGHAWSVPARYRSCGLEIDCLLPRWTDVAYYAQENPCVLLVVQLNLGTSLCWLQYRGVASPVARPDWNGLLPKGIRSTRPDDLYLVVHVKPQRIDLVDESSRWGVSETLDFARVQYTANS